MGTGEVRTLIISDLWMPFPGGAERYVANLADALAQRGHEIHILTSYTKAKSHHRLTIKSINCWQDITSFFCEFDATISHHYFADQYPEIFSFYKPSIEIVHNRQRNPNASLAIFNSNFTAQRCGIREGDMIILPPAGNDVIAGLSAPRDCIGHIKPIPNHVWKGQWYGKGINLTYHLARIMRERRFLVLRGEWQDVELIEQHPNVEFMEPVDDIREFYARCRIVLMPSGSEDAGTVPQECALNGIPCISSNVGGLPETNGGGIQLCPHDILPWMKEIARLDDPAYYDEIVVRQRNHVNALKWPRQFDELDAKLRSLCGK